jgi:hypothetical protein
MSLSSLKRAPVHWSRKRTAALIVFALIMAYLHSFYILGFYTSDIEYWGTVWIGVTTEQRLLSFLLGLFANLGLMAMPFVRAPGRILSAAIALSLAFGLLISVAWLVGDLWDMGLPAPGRVPSTEGIVILLLDILLFALPIAVRVFYAAAIWLNLHFLLSLSGISFAARDWARIVVFLVRPKR